MPSLRVCPVGGRACHVSTAYSWAPAAASSSRALVPLCSRGDAFDGLEGEGGLGGCSEYGTAAGESLGVGALGCTNSFSFYPTVTAPRVACR